LIKSDRQDLTLHSKRNKLSNSHVVSLTCLVLANMGQRYTVSKTQ